jgi:hypothetical protein
MSLIQRQWCVARDITLEQFADVVGWQLSAYMDAPVRICDFSKERGAVESLTVSLSQIQGVGGAGSGEN